MAAGDADVGGGGPLVWAPGTLVLASHDVKLGQREKDAQLAGPEAALWRKGVSRPEPAVVVDPARLPKGHRPPDVPTGRWAQPAGGGGWALVRFVRFEETKSGRSHFM